MKLASNLLASLALAVAPAFPFTLPAAGAAADYAVVVSQKTQADASWLRVVEALRKCGTAN